MTKGAGGIWSVTVGPIGPDILSYHYRIDGVDVLDPHNPGVKLWQGGAARLRPDVEARLVAYPRVRDYNARDKPGGHMSLEKDFPQIVLARDSHGEVWARAWSGSSDRPASVGAGPRRCRP